MICDHDATKASLRVFLAATDRQQIRDFDGATVLTGDCRGCGEPLSVEVDLARGRVVRGELANGVHLGGAAGATPTYVDDNDDPVVQAIR